MSVLSGASVETGMWPALREALHTAWHWMQAQGRQSSKSRRLRVRETVSLGEKRFVSIVEVDGASFLIGGGAGNVSLLTSLGEKPAVVPFDSVLRERWAEKETA